jgi:hypothetical protein
MLLLMALQGPQQRTMFAKRVGLGVVQSIHADRFHDLLRPNIYDVQAVQISLDDVAVVAIPRLGPLPSQKLLARELNATACRLREEIRIVLAVIAPWHLPRPVQQSRF